MAVVLASLGRGPTFEPSVAGFVREAEALGEVVVVEGRPPPGKQPAAPTENAPRFLPSPAGCLVPELWRDGLRSVDADRVAFSTTEMVPRVGWLRSLMDRMDETEAWGVGGAIGPGEGLGPIDRAVYLQRYVGYGPGYRLPIRPSGENSLYRRERLVEVEDAWSEGFWEVEVQRELEGRGATWASEPRSTVDYSGTTRLLDFIGRRLAHARRFGADRAAGWGQIERRLRPLAMPLVPAVLLARAGRNLRRRKMSVGPWLPSVPSLLAIAGAWAAGEALGTWTGSGRS